MQNIHLDESTADSFVAARDEAVGVVADQLERPVVISWCDSNNRAFAPAIPGGDPDSRWRTYGESMGGSFEVDVGDRFHFVIGDAGEFTEAKVGFVNYTDSNGREYLCIDPSCNEEMRRPLDDVYAAGGGRGDG